MPHPNDVFWSVLQTGEVFPIAIGGPGTGKTRSIEAFCRSAGRQCYTLIGSIREPTDYGGFPYPTQCVPIKDPVTDKEISVYMAIVPPKWAFDCWDGQSWTIFMDEMTGLAPAVQSACLGVMTDRRVGDLPLPTTTWMCGAANPADQAANGHEIEMPMANRMFWHNWQADPDVWDSGMTSGWANVAPSYTVLPPDWRNGLGRVGAKIAAFRRVKPSLWNKPPEDRSKRGGPWPSPRSWTMAGTCLAAVESHSPHENGLRQQAVAGCVGEDVAHEFSVWEKTLDLPDPEPVIQNVMAQLAAGKPGNGCVPQLARADQALAFLGALSDRVLHHNPCQERWEAGMEIVHGFWDQWRDLALLGVLSMKAGWKAGWRVDPAFLQKALPLLERAGILQKAINR